MIVVSLKYVMLIMRADNRGEGGIMALLALATASVARPAATGARRCSLIGVFGASLFYGDAVLTPAISVLSAVEGLEVGTAAFKPYVVPIAVGVLVALFADPAPRHRRGRPAVRPGVRAVVRRARRGRRLEHRARRRRSSRRSIPRTRCASSPAHGFASFVVLGSVLLAITGAEALYADMGHFGKRAVRIAWFGLVAPALVLNYFGQGALLIAQPEGARESVLPRCFPAGRCIRWSRSPPRRR